VRPCRELVTCALVALCCLSCHPTPTANTPTPSATVTATWWPTYTPTASATWTPTPTNTPSVTPTRTPIPQATVIDSGEGPGWRHLFAAEIDGPVDVLVDVVPHIPGGSWGYAQVQAYVENRDTEPVRVLVSGLLFELDYGEVGGPLLATVLVDQGALRIDVMGRAWVDVWRFGP